eukprot:1155613-Pelagomonas_calceolata.AAC.4
MAALVCSSELCIPEWIDSKWLAYHLHKCALAIVHELNTDESDNSTLAALMKGPQSPPLGPQLNLPSESRPQISSPRTQNKPKRQNVSHRVVAR